MTNITAHSERIARYYWGEPNEKLSKKGRTLRFGSAGSKELDLQKNTWYDFEEDCGGGIVDIVRKYGKLGISGSVADVLERDFGIQRQAQKALEPKSYIQKIHSYFDADGVEAYQVCRMYPKSFRQRRPDGNGGYIYSVKDVTPLPYNLPAIIQNPDAPIFIVEGEKCADALIEAGLVATTNSGGAKKWDERLTEWFNGRSVVMLPDNDEAGRRHADVVVSALWGRADKIKRVELPGLGEKGDVADYLKDNTLDALLQIVKAAPLVQSAPEGAEPEAADEPGGTPEVAEGELEPFETLDQDAVWSMPPVEFLIDQLLPEKAFTMMYGAPGTGKSFLAIDMALSVAHGVQWQGYDTKQGAVLYIAGEGVGGFGKRWKAWAKHHGLSNKVEMHVVPLAVNFMDGGEVTRLLYTIDKLEKDFALVVVDTVHRSMHGAEENSAAEMARFIDACDTIQRHTGGTMLAVHHAGKSQSQGARGSNSLLGAVSTSLMVGKVDQQVQLRVEKQKDAEPIEDDLRFNMLVVPASISETSVVLERTDEAAKPKKEKLWRPSGNSKRALQIFENMCVDQGTTRIAHSAWSRKMRSDMPDTPDSSRASARDVLIEREWLISVDGVCWKNKDLTDVSS